MTKRDPSFIHVSIDLRFLFDIKPSNKLTLFKIAHATISLSIQDLTVLSGVWDLNQISGWRFKNPRAQSFTGTPLFFGLFNFMDVVSCAALDMVCFFDSPTPIFAASSKFVFFRYHSLFHRACVYDILSWIVVLGTQKCCTASQTDMAPLLTVSTAIFRKLASYLERIRFP